MKISEKYEPKKILEFFELLSSVPHGSGNTKAISDICVGFAKKRGLEYYRDNLNNVVIYKPASDGRENEGPVILQGHLDMVCAKMPDDPTDMSKTPVKLMCDGEWLWADGTSLGADNLIGVSSVLAILDDGTLSHPPIEAVFTTDEETGMFGAIGLDASKLRSKRMINLDSEEEGVFTAGCAGGVRANCGIPFDFEKCGKGGTFCEITVGGLAGGHSGMEINKERGNSNKLLARFLYEASKKMQIRLCGISGGDFDNVITSKTTAKIEVEPGSEAEFEKLAQQFDAIYKNEYQTSDPGVFVKAEKCGREEYALSVSDTKRALECLFILPQGVQVMSMDIKDLPQVSLNMGILRLGGDGLKFNFSIRSSVRSQKYELFDKVKAIVELCGGSVEAKNEYPEWQYRKNSPLRDTALSAYREIYGGEAVVSATHGGLECGLFAEKIPGLDCISYGPELYDVHSVRERLNLRSAERIYKLTCLILEKLN